MDAESPLSPRELDRILAAIAHPVCEGCGGVAIVWCFLCEEALCAGCHTHLPGDQDEE